MNDEGVVYVTCLPKRSECTCDCHKPGMVVFHCMPCCRYEDEADQLADRQLLPPNCT